MLCMQPLEPWVHDAVEPTGLWMYHGHGGGMAKEIGPASWFIVSKRDSYMIKKWKEECDQYWKNYNQAHDYFWMDSLFKKLFDEDDTFKQLWLKVPYLYCELDGQSHTLAHYGMENKTPHIQKLFEIKPPYALKFWSGWNYLFPHINNQKCLNSNGYCAIKLSKRRYSYKHIMS